MERQCLLKRGQSVRVAWLPEEDAVEGKVISDRNSPEFGWTVCKTGSSRKTMPRAD